MGSLLREILQHPNEIYPLVKLKMAVTKKKIPQEQEPHWDFCFSMCFNLSTGFSYILPELDSELRCVMSVFYLVLRALDTIEDDTSIPIDVKVPILKEFYQHINDPEWHFSCGREKYKTLMDQFHHVSTAFMELDKSYQDVIVDITSRMGAGMAKFIDKKIETVNDYDEYCHYAAGLVGLGLSKFVHIAGLEDLGASYLTNSMGLFLQKANIIRDYLEDINEKPPRMFWPHQIWSKYVSKLEDLKYEENSTKAVQCLNDMITNALVHVENCFKCMSPLRDPVIFRLCAIPQIVAFGTLAMAYNNIEFFRGVVKLRRGLIAKIIDQTNTMDDVYGAFYDFSSILKSKVDCNDPNAKITLSRLKTIQKICWDSGSLGERKSYPIKNQLISRSSMVIVLIIAIIFAYLSMIRLRN